MAMTHRPVEVETGSQDRDGLLIFEGKRLLAILVQLSDIHAARSGSWYLEYGLATQVPHEAFDNLDQALAWIEKVDRDRLDEAFSGIPS